MLLQSTGTASFSGADRAGTRRLEPGRTLPRAPPRRSTRRRPAVRAAGSGSATFSPLPLQVRRRRATCVRLRRRRAATAASSSSGPTRSAACTRSTRSRSRTTSRGVVSRELPSSWPQEALKAQAVAARTYAVTTSQGRRRASTSTPTRARRSTAAWRRRRASTNQAVAATRGQIVTYEGEPVVTYFFSTSGGRTENVENTFLGTEPKPWLKSVEDPYDGVSPQHRWGPIKLTLGAGRREAERARQGPLQGHQVLRRGRSPRIVAADVVGTGGRTRGRGATLRARLGLLRHLGALHLDRHAQEAAAPAIPAPAAPPPPPAAAAGPRPRASITGRVPARIGAEVQIQLRTAAAGRPSPPRSCAAAARYRAAVAGAGSLPRRASPATPGCRSRAADRWRSRRRLRRSRGRRRRAIRAPLTAQAPCCIACCSRARHARVRALPGRSPAVRSRASPCRPAPATRRRRPASAALALERQLHRDLRAARDRRRGRRARRVIRTRLPTGSGAGSGPC